MKKPISIEARTYMADKLREANYEGLANEVYWWSDRMQAYHKKHDDVLWEVMSKSLKIMPLLVNSTVEYVKVIAIARLHLGK